MVALPDDAIAELWTLSDASGVRPEWVLPVLYLESGFDPTLQNRAGAPYYGIGQDSGDTLARQGVEPGAYLAMGAAEQLRTVVVPRIAELARDYGPLRSATRVYQANFLPGTLRRAPGLASVLVWRGSPYYESNRLLDVTKDGAITVSDLAWWMAREAREPEVRAAIVRAYEMRPDETPRNVVYGGDFPNPVGTSIVVAAIAAAASYYAR